MNETEKLLEESTKEMLDLYREIVQLRRSVRELIQLLEAPPKDFMGHLDYKSQHRIIDHAKDILARS